MFETSATTLRASGVSKLFISCRRLAFGDVSRTPCVSPRLAPRPRLAVYLVPWRGVTVGKRNRSIRPSPKVGPKSAVRGICPPCVASFCITFSIIRQCLIISLWMIFPMVLYVFLIFVYLAHSPRQTLKI